MRGLMIPRLRPVVHCRLFSSTPSVDKSLLSKLRKQTGIPFINCKKALVKFDNNFDQAKQWLLVEAQKEGWARATKLQSRPMSQGLIAVMADGKKATMLEVNCETDFVAKNDKFVAMVTKLVQECNKHFENQPEKKMTMDKNQLGQLKSSEEMTLADIVVLTIGNLGENMAIRRGTFIRASEDSVLSHYVHPSNPRKSEQQRLLLGKYGAIVELRPTDPTTPGPMTLTDLGSQLCQHIVGMNPRNVGEFPPLEASPDAQVSAEEEAKNLDPEERTDGAEKKQDGLMEGDIDEDAALLQQEFLLDTSLLVGELLCMNSTEVLDFARFACGEEIEGEKEE